MLTDVSEVRTASIIRAVMIEAARTSETSVTIYLTTRRYLQLYFFTADCIDCSCMGNLQYPELKKEAVTSSETSVMFTFSTLRFNQSDVQCHYS